MLRQLCHILPVNEDLSRINGPYPGDGIQKGGFSGAVAADDGNEIALLQCQADTL